ncbi:hypothetical protein [Ruegeria profundi]|uniref:hypothetical protein n=1 Tax=Ruegeria profundi TaxID=1685378 RepID=UPI003C7A32EC
MSEHVLKHPASRGRQVSLDQRIAELRNRKPVDLNHGEGLMLQGIAAASLREQRLAGQIAPED